MDNKEIGARLAARRNELGLTLQDVAKRVGIASSTVLRYESGDVQKIKLPVLEALSKALELNPAWVCGKSNKRLMNKDRENGPDITFDDFTYALHNETKELTEENKQKLLEMARFFKEQQDKKKKE